MQTATIANGRCAGDSYFRVIITEADDQMACSTSGGLSSSTKVSDSITISGRCTSTLTGTTGWNLLTPPINNWGIAEPAPERWPKEVEDASTTEANTRFV